MTGRDMIMYILMNHLEDEEIFKDGKLIGYVSIPEFAKKCEVDDVMIMAYIRLGMLPSIQFGGKVYIPENAKIKRLQEVL